MADNEFELLAEPLQHCLWRMGWTELRPIQAKAIGSILQSENDLLISARTAAGKTEAAFLPILSHLVQAPTGSIGAIYVSPLKALINDQFRRLEELCEHAEIPVHRWHGDVDAGAKKRMIEKPNGVLLITPESLESLFVNRSTAIARVFQDLRFVVIDELHAFVGRERGLHLRSLLYRLEQRISHRYRLVALSATLGAWANQYAQWLRPDRAEQIEVLSDTGDQKDILFRIYGYTIGGKSSKTDAKSKQVDEDAEFSPVIDEMFQAFKGQRNLIFANRKDHLEWFADSLNQRCVRAGRPHEFLVHHGSLSKEIREYTEQAMRAAVPHSTLCSSTLELGIDIGNVTAVGQIGPPWSVNSMVQRLGRSGRRDSEPSTMRMYVEEYAIEKDTSLIERLHGDLLQAIALTQLMLEKWLEPPEINSLDLSTLVQQILSVLVETGGIGTRELFDRLVVRGAFSFVDESNFLKVLRALGSTSLIEQMPEGDLILGIEGERLVQRLDFYSAFATAKEYAVLHAGKTIGMLPAIDPPKPPDHVLLAGRRWQVVDTDVNREEILVVPSTGKKLPLFRSSPGEIHTRVRQKMKEIVCGDLPIQYLNRCASGLLADARAAAVNARLPATSWHQPGPNDTVLFTWVGTRTQRTLRLISQVAGLSPSDRDIALEFRAPPNTVRDSLLGMLRSMPTSYNLAQQAVDKMRRKFDIYLSNELLTTSYAHDALNIEEAVSTLERVVQE